MAGRLNYIDNLRVFCILIVVFIHSGVTYSTLGSWYYTEPSTLPVVSKLFFAFFQSHAQAFSMSLFFFIAAYFIPKSLERKGAKKFITDRLLRLGIPVLIYMFLIHTLCVKLVHPDLNSFRYVLEGLGNFSIIGRTGPLWFAFTLLIFSLIYVAVSGYLPSVKDIKTGTGVFVILILIITAGAFGIRLIYPIGTSFINLQFCYFSAYIVMFVAGIYASKHSVLENLNLRTGRKWLLIGFCIGLPLWFSALYTGKLMEGKMLIAGGLNISSFLYALWESLFCVSFIVALFGIAKEKFNTQGRLMSFLSANTFGIYVFHAPVLIAISLLARGVNADPLIKFFVVGLLAILSTLIVSFFVRKIPVLGRFFN